jgi:hypothetical protein
LSLQNPPEQVAGATQSVSPWQEGGVHCPLEQVRPVTQAGTHAAPVPPASPLPLLFEQAVRSSSAIPTTRDAGVTLLKIMMVASKHPRRVRS